MRCPQALLAGLLLASTASAATRPPAGPRAIGRFDDWQAAVHEEAGNPVCYAFTRAAPPASAGVVLTVTERAPGRDVVAISAGMALPKGADLTLAVGSTRLRFYPAGRSAFARDGGQAVAAFGRGSRAIGTLPGPKPAPAQFSLRGFAPALAAIHHCQAP